MGFSFLRMASVAACTVSTSSSFREFTRNSLRELFTESSLSQRQLNYQTITSLHTIVLGSRAFKYLEAMAQLFTVLEKDSVELREAGRPRSRPHLDGGLQKSLLTF